MQWNHKQSIKEVAKHLLFKCGFQAVLNTYRNRHGYVTEHLKDVGTAERFKNIYQRGAWLHEDNQEARSGVGSEASRTKSIVAELPN